MIWHSKSRKSDTYYAKVYNFTVDTSLLEPLFDEQYTDNIIMHRSYGNVNKNTEMARGKHRKLPRSSPVKEVTLKGPKPHS